MVRGAWCGARAGRTLATATANRRDCSCLHPFPPNPAPCSFPPLRSPAFLPLSPTFLPHARLRLENQLLSHYISLFPTLGVAIVAEPLVSSLEAFPPVFEEDSVALLPAAVVSLVFLCFVTAAMLLSVNSLHHFVRQGRRLWHQPGGGRLCTAVAGHRTLNWWLLRLLQCRPHTTSKA